MVHETKEKIRIMKSFSEIPNTNSTNQTGSTYRIGKAQGRKKKKLSKELLSKVKKKSTCQFNKFFLSHY